MKKILTAIWLMGMTLTASAQKYMRIWQNGESIRVALQDIVYSDGGQTITTGTATYRTADVDSITIVKHVTVTYDGNQATVDLDAAEGIVTATVDGAHVTLNNPNTTEEMEFELKGSSDNGSFTYIGSYKCKIHLNGVKLTSTIGAAIDIQCGKRVDVIMAKDSENVLNDCEDGLQKACLYCKGHMEIAGEGTLHVEGNSWHAIATNEYLRLKPSTGNIIVTKAKNDAIHAGQYFQMDNGNIQISGAQGDGIQAEVTKDLLDEMNGQLMIQGGKINITLTNPDTKGIRCDSTMTISGGDIHVEAVTDGSKGITTDWDMYINEDHSTTNIYVLASGAQYEDPVTEETSRCMGMRTRRDLYISAGTVEVRNTGSGSRGIKVDGTYHKIGGKVTASVNAGNTTVTM